MLDQIKKRVEELEDHLKQLVHNHTVASGQLAEAKMMLDIAQKDAGEVVVDNVVDVVEHAVEEVAPIAE